MLEDAAYRRLLCLYYRKEQPIPIDIGQACRLVRAISKDERAAVDAVLREFFDECPDGWRHKRCDRDISEAAAIGKRNRENGKSGGRPVRPGNPEETQEKPSGLFLGSISVQSGNLSHKPLATSHEKAKAESTSFAPQASPKDGSRIPEGFKPDVDWALARHPEVDVVLEAEKFCDYWESRAGKDARRTDWPKVWKNWVRKASQDIANKRPPNRGAVANDDWRKVAV